MARRSLRGRVALWMVASAALSLALFTASAYVVVSLAEAMERGDEALAAETRRQVFTALAIAAPIGLLAATGGAQWLSRRALAPVDRMIDAARAITIESLDHRLDVPGRDDELRALAIALNDALDRLERGHRTLEMFAADASHELRTPIAAICSELEVALRRPRAPDEWERSARTALDELRRLARVIDSLLRFAQAGAAASQRRDDVELASLVDDVTELHGAAARAAGVELVARCADEVHVTGDPDMLSTAISNLVANAIRYTPRGGSITVTVTVTVERAGDAAHVHVDDTGEGLAAGELEAIFAPFARGAQARTADAAGLGLGLPIARRIAERHGGAIAACNRPGGGARFSLRLPLARRAGAPA